MKIAMITRKTLFSVPGGDTTQIKMTAKYLKSLGVHVDIKLSNEPVDYEQYDLLHFFNIIRPDDILRHVVRTKTPFVVSTIFVDYSEYERKARQGIMRMAGKVLNQNSIEYVKFIARLVKNGEKINSPAYLIKGQKRSIQFIAERAAMLLPNSHSEYNRFVAQFQVKQRYQKVVNAIDPACFNADVAPNLSYKDHIICVGRIEGLKNQLNLIKALSDTGLPLTLIGKPAPNHADYAQQCRNLAATTSTIQFIEHIDPASLAAIYQAAKVHVLPSWFETTGLSSLEAGAMGCNLVITPKGDQQEYFRDMAYYCEPDDLGSIKKAVLQAYNEPTNPSLQTYIQAHYTWKDTAEQTLQAYQQVLGKEVTA